MPLAIARKTEEPMHNQHEITRAEHSFKSIPLADYDRYLGARVALWDLKFEQKMGRK